MDKVQSPKATLRLLSVSALKQHMTSLGCEAENCTERGAGVMSPAATVGAAVGAAPADAPADAGATAGAKHGRRCRLPPNADRAS